MPTLCSRCLVTKDKLTFSVLSLRTVVQCDYSAFSLLLFFLNRENRVPMASTSLDSVKQTAAPCGGRISLVLSCQEGIVGLKITEGAEAQTHGPHYRKTQLSSLFHSVFLIFPQTDLPGELKPKRIRVSTKEPASSPTPFLHSPSPKSAGVLN